MSLLPYHRPHRLFGSQFSSSDLEIPVGGILTGTSDSSLLNSMKDER
jgi:hypothetical protein